MKNIQKKSFLTKPKVAIIIAAVLVVALGGLASAYSIGSWPFETKQSTTPKTPVSSHSDKIQSTQVVTTSQQAQVDTVAAQETKKQAINNRNQPNNPSPSKFSVTISAANQNNPTLQIRAFVDLVTNDAICQLTLTKGTSKVTRTVGTQATASISSCKGFDIPISELSPGTWELTVTVSNGPHTGTATKTVEIS